jgi:hypothetical protein
MVSVKKSQLREEFTENFVRDWWLTKYHNTTCAEIAEKYPVEAANGDWYKLFKVSQEQHDEWYTWFISEVKRRWGFTKKMAEYQTAIAYLNVSPSVKEKEATD